MSNEKEFLINVTERELALIQMIIGHSAAFDKDFEIISGYSVDKIYDLLREINKVYNSPNGSTSIIRI